MYNLLIGGAAGQGIDTTAAILEKLLKRSGYFVLTVRDFMSRVRGGHNFSLMRFDTKPVYSHSNRLDAIIAMDEETIALHQDQLKEGGFILCDSKLSTEHSGAIKVDMAGMAKQLGNPRVAGIIAVGIILKLFGESLDGAEEVLRAFVKPQFVEINVKALQEGYQATETRFSHQNGTYQKHMLVSGSNAVTLGAVAAGLRFYAAYPMSPSTSIMETLAALGDEAGLVVEQAEDEIAAINMAIGASFAGARAMTGTSGGGFSLMVEALGLSGMAEIPLVVIDVQRPGPVTGLPTRTEQSDLRFVISASQGEFPRVVIALRNAEDAFYQTMRAFDLAEKYQIPVILLSDQYIGDATSTVAAFDPTKIQVASIEAQHKGEDAYLRYQYTENGISPRLIPGMSKHLVAADSDEHDERGWITESAEVRTRMMDKRMKKLEGIQQDLQEPEFVGVENFETLLIGWGSTWGPIQEAVQQLNKDGGRYAALLFGDVYPLPQKSLLELAPKAKRMFNIEQNATGQFALLIREQTGITCTANILKYDGRQISAEEIVERVKKEESK